MLVVCYHWNSNRTKLFYFTCSFATLLPVPKSFLPLPIIKWCILYTSQHDSNLVTDITYFNFVFFQFHSFLVFKRTAVSHRNDGNSIGGFKRLPLCHDFRHDLSTVVTQIIPEIRIHFICWNVYNVHLVKNWETLRNTNKCLQLGVKGHRGHQQEVQKVLFQRRRLITENSLQWIMLTDKKGQLPCKASPKGNPVKERRGEGYPPPSLGTGAIQRPYIYHSENFK